MEETPRFYEFADFRVDAVARRLSRRDGAPVEMTPRVFDTLLYLIEHRGAIRGKDEMIAAIWPGRVVEENNLSQSISSLRRALGEGRDGARYVLTIPGRGFRFVAEVRVAAANKTARGSRAAWWCRSRAAPRMAPRRKLPWCPQRQDRMASATASRVKVLAVLPFRSLLPAQRDDAFVMGMAETLIARLSNSPEIAVRPQSLARRYDTLERGPLAAGREMGADIVLDGALQRHGARLRVTARLLRVRDGVALWSGRFDVEFTSVFDVQDAISGRVADALALRTGGDEKQMLTRRDTGNVDAYQCYLTGRHHIAKLTPPEIRKGIAMFEQAIALDPRYARAYAGAADAYRRLPIACDWRPTGAFPRGAGRGAQGAGAGRHGCRSAFRAGLRALLVRLALGRG